MNQTQKRILFLARINFNNYIRGKLVLIQKQFQAASTQFSILDQFCRKSGWLQHLNVPNGANAAANLSGIDHSVLSVMS